MRKLLERWAKLAPEKCKLTENDYFKISLDADNWHLVYPDNPVFQDLMWIQWAVQAAIISRGWRWNLECYPVSGICEGLVFYNSDHIRRTGNNPAEALLGAYLAALEEEAGQAKGRVK